MGLIFYACDANKKSLRKGGKTHGGFHVFTEYLLISFSYENIRSRLRSISLVWGKASI
jgi:hypothetical protein